MLLELFGASELRAAVQKLPDQVMALHKQAVLVLLGTCVVACTADAVVSLQTQVCSLVEKRVSWTMPRQLCRSCLDSGFWDMAIKVVWDIRGKDGLSGPSCGYLIAVANQKCIRRSYGVFW